MDAATFLKVNSQAIWSFAAAVINLGILFGWLTFTPTEIAAINVAYVAGVMMLRQLFTLTPLIDDPNPTTINRLKPLDPIPDP